MVQVTCPRCTRTWSGLRAEHCTVCHETFTSTSAGDAHRVGHHGFDRRCLPIEEVKKRDKRGGPEYGLKWNPTVRVWGWDKPRPAFFELTGVAKWGPQGGSGTHHQVEVSTPQTGVR